MPLAEALRLQVHSQTPRLDSDLQSESEPSLAARRDIDQSTSSVQTAPSDHRSAQREIEFFASDSRCIDTVLALTSDRGVVEECLRDDPAAAGPENYDGLAAVVHRDLCHSGESGAGQCLKQQSVGWLATTVRHNVKRAVEVGEIDFGGLHEFAGC